METFLLWFTPVMLVVTLIFGTRKDRQLLGLFFGAVAVAGLLGLGLAVVLATA